MKPLQTPSHMYLFHLFAVNFLNSHIFVVTRIVEEVVGGKLLVFVASNVGLDDQIAVESEGTKLIATSIRDHEVGGCKAHTLSIASASSGVTEMVRRALPSSPSSLPSERSCRKASGCWEIRAASCGFPCPTCCKIGSSICGDSCTRRRSCWNWTLLRRKSSPAIPAALPAPARPPAPPRAAAPPSLLAAAAAAASKRLIFSGSAACS